MGYTFFYCKRPIPDWKVQTSEWNVEDTEQWRTEDTDKFFYEIEEKKMIKKLKIKLFIIGLITRLSLLCLWF